MSQRPQKGTPNDEVKYLLFFSKKNGNCNFTKTVKIMNTSRCSEEGTSNISKAIDSTYHFFFRKRTPTV